MPGVKGQKSGGHNKKSTKHKLVSGRNLQRIKDAPEIACTRLLEYPGLGEIGIKFRQTYYQMMLNNGTWSEEYSDALHLLANAAEQWHEADEAVKEHGRVEDLYDGKTNKKIGSKPSGEHKIERDLHQAYMQLLSLFGREPKTRDDIKKIASKKSINPFAGKL